MLDLINKALKHSNEDYIQDKEDEDFVSDIVLNILKIIGYDIHDYEMDGGFCTINGVHFLDAGLDMGYDYLRLAEDFRDSNI